MPGTIENSDPMDCPMNPSRQGGDATVLYPAHKGTRDHTGEPCRLRPSPCWRQCCIWGGGNGTVLMIRSRLHMVHDAVKIAPLMLTANSVWWISNGTILHIHPSTNHGVLHSKRCTNHTPQSQRNYCAMCVPEIPLHDSTAHHDKVLYGQIVQGRTALVKSNALPHGKA